MRLGYLLDDEKLLSVAKENIDWVLEHPLPAKKAFRSSRRMWTV